ncbi:MAG: type II toxin-antitoxin system VapC family toxin [Pseudonocardiales bacterium]|nr:type II toxin-antitoxin system VapC family toxin [Pseudonocardiales bacterium]
MIVDSSALVAILLAEPGHQVLVDHLARAPVVGVGAPTLAETGIVLTAHLGVVGRSLLARLLHEVGAETVPCTAAHWPVAVDAFTRYGKRRHPAGLNFGDCLTYATCRLAGRPLLCVGDDFPQTDLELVNPPEHSPARLGTVITHPLRPS